MPFAGLNVAELDDSLPRQLSAQQLSPRQPVGWKYIASLVADLEVHRGVREIPPEFVDRRVARHSRSDCVGIHQPARQVLHRDAFANAAQNRRQLIARAPQILLSGERELVQAGSLQGLGTLPRKREEQLAIVGFEFTIAAKRERHGADNATFDDEWRRGQGALDDWLDHLSVAWKACQGFSVCSDEEWLTRAQDFGRG